MCRHLAWLGAPRSLGDLLLDPGTRAAGAVIRPAPAANGLMNADGWGVGVLLGRPAGARALALEPAAVDRRVVRVGGAGDLLALRAGRGALGHGRDADRRDGGRAVQSRPVAAVAQRASWTAAGARPAPAPRSRRATPRCSRRTCSSAARSGLGEYVAERWPGATRAPG